MRNRISCLPSTLVMALAMLAATVPGHAGAGSAVVTEVDAGLFVVSGLQWDVNVAYLVTDEGVLVVDSGNDGDEGKAIAELIEKRTGERIRYLVLTHYHGDHTAGWAGFPQSVTVIAHRRCAENIARFEPEQMAALPGRIEELRNTIAEMKAEEGGDVDALEARLAQSERLLRDYESRGLVSPDLTFEERITISLGGETVEIFYPGPAHTSGNAIVYFPGKNAVVMGDMLFHGYHPYIDWQAGSDTANWIAALQKLSGREIEKVIPGHGKVAGREALEAQSRYLSALRREVGDELAPGSSLEQLQQAVSMAEFEHLGFPEMLPYGIEAVYHELTDDAPAAAGEE